MKKGFALFFVVIQMLCFLCGCGNDYKSEDGQKGAGNEVQMRIELNSENFQYYFYSDVYGDIKVNTSAMGSTYFVNTVHLSFDLKQTAVINNVTVQGRIDLKVSNTHLLYSEGKLPLYFSVNIPASGHGEKTLYFQHGIGAYGGFSAKDDYYVTIESATGTITIN